MSTAYQTNFANKPETPESKAALEKLNVVMDRIVDAYARAIASAGTDPKTDQSRREWLAQASTYYKFRHGGSDAGLTEFIASVLQKPVPPKP
jgi:phage shock protein A